jgi:tetratricopeptide (TPR) repeat protein
MTQEADAVWVYSSYLRDCYLRSGVPAERLQIVPLGVDPALFHPDATPRTLRTGKRFKFLFVGGTIHRKGIDVLLDAYRAAFTVRDDVCLVVKDLGGNSFYRGQTARQRLTCWHDDSNAPEIEYLDGDWPDSELPGLYTACDCLVAPYRGEGFGLPIAEALACARPTIVTGHGAALDFCSNDNAYLIPACPVYSPSRRIGEWETVDYPWLAEPDRDALIDLLRHVAAHPDEAHAKGQAGAALIHQRFTWDHTAQRVEELLLELRRQPIHRLGRTIVSPGAGVPRPVATPAVAAPRSEESQPRLSLTMIVKNEAATLATCLDSVRGLVDEIVLVDTGSTDATKDIATARGARIIELPWPDSFAAARNESLCHASGQWLLWLDADEYFDDANRDKLRALLASLGEDNAAFVMKQTSTAAQGGSATLVDQVRLFRNHPAARWDYRVHEQLLPSLRKAGFTVHFTDIAIQHTGYQDPALRHHKLERNLRLLQLDLADRPDDPFTLFNVGWAYADLGRFADAVPLLQRSLQHSHAADSITPKLYVLLTQCHRRLGQHAEAMGACRAGRLRCPDDAELLFVEGMLRHGQGDRAGARACWQRLLPASDPSAALPAAGGFGSIESGLRGYLVHHHLAVMASEEGRDGECESHWRAALAQAPSFLPGRTGLAELYLKQRRWEELEPMLAELASDPTGAVEAALLRSRALLTRREFSAARRLLDDLLSHYPDLLKARVVLSHVLLQSGDEDTAEPVLRHILAADPLQAESWRNLIVLLRRQGRTREALNVVASARNHRPDDAELLLLQGTLLRECSDAAAAEGCLLPLLEADPTDPAAQLRSRVARHNLALAYRDLGRLAEAAAHWRALLTEDPGFTVAYRCLAETYLALGRCDDVTPLLARLDPAVPQTAVLRSRLHLARREFAPARRLLEEAIASLPRSLEARMLLSYVHLQEGRDPDAAERALRDVLVLDPDNAEARHNLQLLRRQLCRSG